MATIFPSTPTIGDEYNGYSWDGTSWNLIGNQYNPASYSATAPSNPKPGDIWIESDVDVPSISPETILTTTAAASTYQPLVSGVSDTEIGYLDGVTSSIQTQINTKAVAGSNGVPFAMASGIAAHSSGTVTITYPVGRFTQTPQLIGTCDGGGSSQFNRFALVWSGNTSSSGVFIVRLTDSTIPTQAFNVHWTAIQMTSGSASG